MQWEIWASATVLTGIDQVRMFEEVVREDDELSHEGSESEFFAFTPREETEVEVTEHRVVARGNQGGLVKDRADRRAAAEDVALTAELTAVVVRRTDLGRV